MPKKMTEILDKEILDLNIAGQTIGSMTALTFLQWVSGKINGVPAYTAANQELVMAVSHAPLSNAMPDAEKIRLVRKMISVSISIP